MDVEFIYRIPDSGKYRHAVDGSPCQADYGDRGNCLKMIEDALEGIIYVNDCQIARGEVSKSWGLCDMYRIKLERLL